MFTSQLGKKELIINDETPSYLLDAPDGMSRGLDLGFRGPADYEYGDLATPFPDSLYVPESDWRGIIQEQEERKARISDFVRHRKLPHKDQSSTNYCWVNAPTHCVEISRMQQNQEMISLSPASAGAQIKNYRNVGGWGLEALEFIVKFGVAPSSMWPDNAIESKYATAATKAAALDYRVDEWIECQPRNKNQMISLLLRGFPGAGGYNWWRHEVTNAEAVWLDGEVAVRIRNSWKGWGDFGFGILQGSKMLADDLVFCLNTRPA